MLGTFRRQVNNAAILSERAWVVMWCSVGHGVAAGRVGCGLSWGHGGKEEGTQTQGAVVANQGDIRTYTSVDGGDGGVEGQVGMRGKREWLKQ